MAHKIVQNSEITASSYATVELNCNANQFNHSFYYCSLKILWKNHLGMWLIYLTEIGSYRKGVVLPVAMRRRSQPQMICGRLSLPTSQAILSVSKDNATLFLRSFKLWNPQYKGMSSKFEQVTFMPDVSSARGWEYTCRMDRIRKC